MDKARAFPGQCIAGAPRGIGNYTERKGVLGEATRPFRFCPVATLRCTSVYPYISACRNEADYHTTSLPRRTPHDPEPAPPRRLIDNVRMEAASAGTCSDQGLSARFGQPRLHAAGALGPRQQNRLCRPCQQPRLGNRTPVLAQRARSSRISDAGCVWMGVHRIGSRLRGILPSRMRLPEGGRLRDDHRTRREPSAFPGGRIAQPAAPHYAARSPASGTVK